MNLNYATSASLNAPSITYNANSIVTVTVSSNDAIPAGVVTLSVDGGAPTSQNLAPVYSSSPQQATATFTLTSPSAGAHPLSASYAAQANFAASSASGTLNVNIPVPAITLLGPSSAAKGGPDFTLTITGTNFVDTSIVQWNGATRAPVRTTTRPKTFVSSTVLTAMITAADIANAGVGYITVVNPAPGGGTSNSQAFFINTTGAQITSSNTVSGTNPSATTGGSNGVTVNATGDGTVTVGIYNANPGGTPSFSSSGAYMDVHVAPGNTFTSLTLVDCNLNGGTQVLWWNGTTWALASNQSYNSSTHCVTITVDNSTSPRISDLTGTPFGAAASYYLYLPLVVR